MNKSNNNTIEDNNREPELKQSKKNDISDSSFGIMMIVGTILSLLLLYYCMNYVPMAVPIVLMALLTYTVILNILKDKKESYSAISIGADVIVTIVLILSIFWYWKIDSLEDFDSLN